jgi:hypothetical protein
VALRDSALIMRVGEDWSMRPAYPGARATALAFGAGHLWASLPEANAVARIDPDDLDVRRRNVGPQPAGLAAAGGGLFVARNTTDSVAVLDAERLGRPAERLRVPANPSAVTHGAGHVWVTGVARGTLTRLDY